MLFNSPKNIAALQRPLAFILLIGILSHSGAMGQSFPPKVSEFISIEDHKGHPQIFCLEKFDQGPIAFGTAGEILVHNGEELQHIPIGEGKEVHSIDQGPKGRIYVGGRSLMGMLVPDSTGDLKYRSLLSLLQDSLRDFGTIWRTRATADGVYFNAQEKKLFYYRNGTFSVIRPENSFYTMHAPAGKPVIQDRDTGLFRLEEDQKVFLDGSRSLAKGKDIREILKRPAQKDGAWTVLTRESGAYHYDPDSGSIEKFMSEKGGSEDLFQEKVYTAARMDSASNPYGATYAVGTILNGIHFLNARGEKLLQIDSEDGLPSNATWEVFRDERGNIWNTTNEGVGLIHTGAPFTMIEEGKGYKGDIMDIVRSDRDAPDQKGKGPLFLATSQGVWECRGDRSEWSRIPGTEGNCNKIIPITPEMEVGGMSTGDLLIAGTNRGLLLARPDQRKDDPSWKVEVLAEQHAYDITRISAPVLESEEDLFILSGRDGLFILEPKKGELTRKDLEERAKVKDIPERLTYTEWDTNGTSQDSIRVWAAMSAQGLLAIKADREFRTLRKTQYDSSSGFGKKGVQILGDPREEGLIFGTKGGLYRFSRGQFLPYCSLSEFLCNTGRQVFRLEKGPGDAFWVNDGKGGKIKHFPKGSEKGERIDSLPFRFMDLGTIWAIFPEKEKTWFGGAKGAACYYPELKRSSDLPWSCRIQEVRGANDSLLFGGTFWEKVPSDEKHGLPEEDRLPLEEQASEMIPTLPYSEGRVRFKFAAAFPDRQEKVRYSYRLKGFDTAWSNYTNKTEKEYTNLPEGSYCFKVKAENIYGDESRVARYQFRILPPWYRTWWAYSCYSLSSVGFIVLLIWLNSRRLIAQKQRLEKVVRERTQEISDQKERIENQKKEVEAKNQALEKAHDQLKEAHREITASIDYARKIQQALLQSEEYISGHLPEHFILFKPQATVSGDFYWAREQSGYLYFAAIDCTGHGVPGAFMSMLGINQLNEIMATKESPAPGEILTELRQRVVAELQSGDPESGAKDGMDAAIIKIPLNEGQNPDPNPKKVEFAGAYNPLYVVKKGIAETIPDITFQKQEQKLVEKENDPSAIKPFKKSPDGFEIKGDKMTVGYDPDPHGAFATAELEVPVGAMLYLFSDGYADQFGGQNGKKFRYGPFKELLASVHRMAAEEQKTELDRVFEEWKTESQQEQIDDVVVVGVRV